MLNELMNFKRSMDMWGCQVPVSYHPYIQKNGKGIGYRVILSENGIEEFDEFPEYKDMYCISTHNQASALTFKLPLKYIRSKLLKKCVTCFKYNIDLFDKLGMDNDELSSLRRLRDVLLAINPETFLDDLLTRFGDNKATVYICLEIPDKSVQTLETIELISEALFGNQKSSREVDFFGNDASGSGENFNPIVTKAGRFKLYARNKDNKCLMRFGLKSIDAAVVGNDSRSELTNIAKFIFTSANQANRSQAGIWYWQSIGKSTDKSQREYVVMTTLYPHDQTVEIDAGNIDPDEWLAKLKAIVSSLYSQAAIREGGVGNVTIFRILKGAWHVESSSNKPLTEIANSVTRWHDGAINGSMFVPLGKFMPISINNLLSCMNKTWKMSNNEFSSDVTKTINVVDAYNFFFDHEPTVRRFAEIFSNRFCPLLLKCMDIDRTPFELNHLVPIRNMILHKLGYVYNRKECSMNDWSFYLGRLFREANSLYRMFFLMRGSTVPKMLIGQRFVMMAYQNPRSAYHQFITAFAPCMQWAESCNENGKQNGYTKRFRELTTKISELTGGNMSIVPTCAERHLLTAGYMDFQKQEQEQKETVNVEE